MLTFCTLASEIVSYSKFSVLELKFITGLKLSICSFWFLLQDFIWSLHIRLTGNPLVAMLEVKERVC